MAHEVIPSLPGEPFNRREFQTALGHDRPGHISREGGDHFISLVVAIDNPISQDKRVQPEILLRRHTMEREEIGPMRLHGEVEDEGLSVLEAGGHGESGMERAQVGQTNIFCTSRQI